MNIKQQFYHVYYDDFDPRQFEDKTDQKEADERNKIRFQAKNHRIHKFAPRQEANGTQLRASWYAPGTGNLSKITGYSTFRLTTTYPGLLIGTGYRHETNTEDEITIGFYFDHVTGLPALPGSSVKGLLRSAFPRRSLTGNRVATEIATSKEAFIRKCLTAAGVRDLPTDEAWVDQLEKVLFDGELQEQECVFFDALLTKPDDEGQILGPDFITPHSADGLGEPIPLRLLKVLPSVGFTFQFLLFDVTVGQLTVTAAQINQMFRLILMVNGVGAKTAVGYGALIDPDGATNLAFLDSDLPIVGGKASPPGGAGKGGPKVIDPEPPPSPQVVLPELADAEMKWFKAADITDNRKSYSIPGLVLEKINDKTVRVQLLISGLEKKGLMGKITKRSESAHLVVKNKRLPDVGTWVEVRMERFDGTGSNVKNVRLGADKFKLLGKRKK